MNQRVEMEAAVSDLATVHVHMVIYLLNVNVSKLKKLLHRLNVNVSKLKKLLHRLNVNVSKLKKLLHRLCK